MAPADMDEPATPGGDDDGWSEAIAEASKAGAPAPPPPPKAAAVLDQSEIDSRLGFADDTEEAQPVTGIRAILNRGPLSYERLPMLEVVFDRLVRLMSTSLRKFTSDNVEVSLEAISTVRFGDYLNRVPLPAMLAIFKAEQWENYGLITADSALIYSAVDILLGGRRGSAAIRIEGRPYTTIERSLVERMIHVMLADLSTAFEPLSPVTFKVERLETNPRFASITQQHLGNPPRRKPVADGRRAYRRSRRAHGAAARDLRAQGRLMFEASPDSLIEMRCSGVPMYSARMGRSGERIAVQIDGRAPRSSVNKTSGR